MVELTPRVAAICRDLLRLAPRMTGAMNLGGLAAELIRSSQVAQADLLARVAKAAIVVLATVMALRQAGLAEDVILLAFGLTLGALAVAAAIAFGVGGRDVARRYIERWTGGGKPSAGTPPGGPGTPPSTLGS